MRVIKRDGRTVEYNRNKILIAIRKANAEVDSFEKASDDLIDGIVASIENSNRDTMQVEDIQDLIEQKLMAAGKFILSKKYIIYRYTRELVRKANTTDDSIMSLIQNSNKDVMEENSNKNAYVASTQRDLIAGEVSKDLTKRVLLPEKITKAHEEGVLHFHDMDYFIQPIFNCCLINIGDMLENGTVMNGKLIESPKSFQVACTVVTQIISALASTAGSLWIRGISENICASVRRSIGSNICRNTGTDWMPRSLSSSYRTGCRTSSAPVSRRSSTRSIR